MTLQNYYNDFEIGCSEPAIGKLADLLARVVPGQLEKQQTSTGGTVSGRYSSISIDTHIHFFSCDVTFEKDNDIRGMIPACLFVCALFAGDHETVIGNELVRFPGSGMPSVLTIGEPNSYVDHHRANQPKRMASYMVAREFFEQSQMQGDENPLARLADLFDTGITHHQICNPETISETLLRLLNSPYQGHIARLFLEATVTASLFSLAQSLSDARGSTFKRTVNNRSLALEARQLIDSEPEQFSSVIALAARLGTNGTTLQREFKAHNGVTIFQYVLKRRMQAARMLIRDRHLAISEIAYKVGYNSPASFSTAYKRFFGHQPVQDRS